MAAIKTAPVRIRGARVTAPPGYIAGRMGTESGELQLLSLADVGAQLSKQGSVQKPLPSGSQGSLLYYGATGLAVLAPGTSGQFLKTQGAGANPVWAAGGGGGTVNIVQNTANDGASITGVTLSTAPVNGNFLLAFIGGNIGSLAAGWALFAPADVGGSTITTLAWKLAGASEPTTQNPLAVGSSCGMVIYEINGAGAGGQTFHDVITTATNTINPVTLGTSAIILGFAYNETSNTLPSFTGATADSSSSTTHGVQGWRVASPVAGSNSITATYGAAVSNRLAAVVVH